MTDEQVAPVRGEIVLSIDTTGPPTLEEERAAISEMRRSWREANEANAARLAEVAASLKPSASIAETIGKIDFAKIAGMPNTDQMRDFADKVLGIGLGPNLALVEGAKPFLDRILGDGLSGIAASNHRLLESALLPKFEMPTFPVYEPPSIDWNFVPPPRPATSDEVQELRAEVSRLTALVEALDSPDERLRRVQMDNRTRRIAHHFDPLEETPREQQP